MALNLRSGGDRGGLGGFNDINRINSFRSTLDLPIRDTKKRSAKEIDTKSITSITSETRFNNV